MPQYTKTPYFKWYILRSALTEYETTVSLLGSSVTCFRTMKISTYCVGVINKKRRTLRSGKTAFWFHLWLRCLQSGENWVFGVASRRGRSKPITKPGNAHCDWFILPLLLPTQIIWFSQSHKQDKATES